MRKGFLFTSKDGVLKKLMDERWRGFLFIQLMEIQKVL
jgi:hypothetical protein